MSCSRVIGENSRRKTRTITNRPKSYLLSLSLSLIKKEIDRTPAYYCYFVNLFGDYELTVAIFVSLFLVLFSTTATVYMVLLLLLLLLVDGGGDDVLFFY